MKRSIIALAALASAAFGPSAPGAFAEGGASFALSGAINPGATYSVENKDSVYAGLSSFANTSAAGLIDGKLSFSRDYTSLGLLDFTFSDEALLDSEDNSTLESTSFAVNELYTDLNFGDLVFLRLGKQRLSWGSGFVFNPSDPVNPPKNPTSRRAVREGVPALKAEIIAKPVSLMAFAVLYDDFKESGYGAKLSTSALPNTDLSLSGYWSPSQSWTSALNASLAPFYDLPGWDSLQLWFEGSLYDSGRYAAYAAGGQPGSATTAASSEGQYAALVGISGQVPKLRTVALAEYYRLSEGLSKRELASVYRALRDPATRAQSMAWAPELGSRPGRQASDYLFVSISQPSITDSGDPILDKLGLSATCLVNLVDGSSYTSGNVDIALVKNSSVGLGANWAQGGDDSEFGNAPSALSLDLEMKVFF
jgi:hypothetical protein